jgi:hypothetical protein
MAQLSEKGEGAILDILFKQAFGCVWAHGPPLPCDQVAKYLIDLIYFFEKFQISQEFP